MEREKKDSEHTSMKTFMENLAVSWGHIEQCFKCYKIKSQVYRRAVTERTVAITWPVYSFARVCEKGRFPDVVSLEKRTRVLSICRDGRIRRLGSGVIPHWQIIVTQIKRPNIERPAARMQPSAHPSHQSNAGIFNGLSCNEFKQ